MTHRDEQGMRRRIKSTHIADSARREWASVEPCAAAGTEGVNPLAGWPGMPLWTRPLPLCACRAGLRREFAAIQTWAGRPR